jgi:hypothetical protein
MSPNNARLVVTCSECGDRIPPVEGDSYLYALSTQHECFFEEGSDGRRIVYEIPILFKLPGGGWNFNDKAFDFEWVPVENGGVA